MRSSGSVIKYLLDVVVDRGYRPQLVGEVGRDVVDLSILSSTNDAPWMRDRHCATQALWIDKIKAGVLTISRTCSAIALSFFG